MPILVTRVSCNVCLQHCGRYDHVAKALCEAGLVVFSMDHQGRLRGCGQRARTHRTLIAWPLCTTTGHGQSEGDRVHVQQFSHCT